MALPAYPTSKPRFSAGHGAERDHSRYGETVRSPRMLTLVDRAADCVRRFAFVAILPLMVACPGGRGPAPTTASTTDHADTGARSQSVLDDAITAGAPGCSAAVGVKGKAIWTGVRGVADMSSGEAITERTVFDIASVSKQFTAAA